MMGRGEHGEHREGKGKLLVACLVLMLVGAAVSQPTSAPAGTDAKLWERMVKINRKSQSIAAMVADFEQKKFTAMLKKPLVSTGKVRVSGSAMRWDTQKPEPTSMLINEKEVEIYYPNEKTMEVYPIDARLGALAASPLPQLDVLKKYFSFKEIPVTELDPAAKAEGKLGLELTPIEASLREHVERVRVLLDADEGCILRAEMVDADGDRTVIAFSDVKVEARSEGELKIDVPADVKVVRPLDALQGQTDGQGK